MNSRDSSSARKRTTTTAGCGKLAGPVTTPDCICGLSTNIERKKKSIFRKLTKRKRLDEKCESNPNTKPMLILTFAFCLIIVVAGGSVKMK